VTIDLPQELQDLEADLAQRKQALGGRSAGRAKPKQPRVRHSPKKVPLRFGDLSKVSPLETPGSPNSYPLLSTRVGVCLVFGISGKMFSSFPKPSWNSFKNLLNFFKFREEAARSKLDFISYPPFFLFSSLLDRKNRDSEIRPRSRPEGLNTLNL